MTADSNAFQTVSQLPGLTAEERQYLLAVARGEGFYGLGWGNPSAQTIAESMKFGIDPRAGVGSNNWGAEQGSGSAGSFQHVDHHADGSAYVSPYKRHATAAEGAASVARILLKANVKNALNTGFYPGPPPLTGKPTPAAIRNFEIRKQSAGQQIGPLKAAVFSQQDNGYFELNPNKYLEAVTRNYDALTANLKWPALLSGLKETAAEAPLAGSGSPSSDSESTSSGVPSSLQDCPSESESDEPKA